MPARVLVVEDDRKTADLVASYLRHAGHDVTVEHAGDRAASRLERETFDLLVLDLMLPGVDGLTLCKKAREREGTGVILLTARTREEEKVAGLNLGADDYVTKPFSPRELVARVEAVLRRVPPGEGDVIVRGSMRLDASQQSVTLGDRTIDLTPSELAILRALALRPGRVVSRARLVELLPKGSSDTMDRTVDVHVRNLRRKIEAECIETVVGAGYRFVPP
ncbi:MAG TPA: response regulator transcription factor [Candidatus Polarisedimenticolaceae bacterium]|nr:response regulator transcription factor [Candidatus Polarisedimenticolaceae bacterium]